MSELNSTSYYKDNRNDCGLSPMFLILMLLCLGGGDSGLFGGLGGGCGFGGGSKCGSDSGLGGMLPILMLFLLGGTGSTCC